MRVTPGTILDRKYRVERVLGEGGMGIVLAATHVDLEQPVAVKLLHVGSPPQVVTRFLHEGRAAARIKSEHIVKVYDVGKLEDGTPFMVMEYLEGKDLGDVLAREQRLPVQTAVDYVLQACDALAQAHAAGIVHRDVKPANLFLTHRRSGSPCVKVLDFGISKIAQPDGRQTSTQEVFGSPLYMSPEQLLSTRDVDARTDVWALGVVLYELLAGAPPFSCETLAALHMSILQGAVRDVREVRPEVPAGLAAAIAGAMVKEREGRTASIAAFAEQLAPFASPVGLEALAAIRDELGSARMRLAAASAPALGTVPAAPPTLVASQASVGVVVNTREPAGRGTPWLPALLGAFALLAVGGAVLAAASLRRSPGEQAAPLSSDPSAEPSSATAAPPPPAVSVLPGQTAAPPASTGSALRALGPPSTSAEAHAVPRSSTGGGARAPRVAVPPSARPSSGKPLLPEDR